MRFQDTTAGGLPVTIYRDDAKGKWPLHGGVQNPEGDCVAVMWFDGGKYYEDGSPHAYDLVPYPQPSEMALNAAWLEMGAGGYLSGPEALKHAISAAYLVDGVKGSSD